MLNVSPEKMRNGADSIAYPQSLKHLFTHEADQPFQPEKAFDEVGIKLSDDAKIERERAGYRMESSNLNTQGESGSKEEEKQKRKKDREVMAEKAYIFGHIELTTAQVIDTLTWQSQNLRNMSLMDASFLGRDLTRNDVLRVKDGKIISADQDPNDQYVVKTMEQKAAFEQANGICVLKFSADEIGIDATGKSFAIPYDEQKERLDQTVAQIDETTRQLKSGEITPDELPENMRNLVVEGQKDQANNFAPQQGLALKTPSLGADLLPPPPQMF